MLTISKPLSSGQAHSYHQREFSNSQDNYYTEGERVRGEWHGNLAEQWGLKGEVQEEHFARLADGQHPITATDLVRHRPGYEYLNRQGETIQSGSVSCGPTPSLRVEATPPPILHRSPIQISWVAINGDGKYAQTRTVNKAAASTARARLPSILVGVVFLSSP